MNHPHRLKTPSFFQPASPSTVAEGSTPVPNTRLEESDFITTELCAERLKNIISDKIQDRLLHASLLSSTLNSPLHYDIKGLDYEKVLLVLINLIYSRFDDKEEALYPSDMANENTYILMFFYLEYYLDKMDKKLTNKNAGMLLILSFSFANKLLNDDKFNDQDLIDVLTEEFCDIDATSIREGLIAFQVQLLMHLVLMEPTILVKKEAFESYKQDFLAYRSPYRSMEIVEYHRDRVLSSPSVF